MSVVLPGKMKKITVIALLIFWRHITGIAVTKIEHLGIHSVHVIHCNANNRALLWLFGYSPAFATEDEALSTKTS